MASYIWPGAEVIRKFQRRFAMLKLQHFDLKKPDFTFRTK